MGCVGVGRVSVSPPTVSGAAFGASQKLVQSAAKPRSCCCRRRASGLPSLKNSLSARPHICTETQGIPFAHSGRRLQKASAFSFLRRPTSLHHFQCQVQHGQTKRRGVWRSAERKQATQKKTPDGEVGCRPLQRLTHTTAPSRRPLVEGADVVVVGGVTGRDCKGTHDAAKDGQSRNGFVLVFADVKPKEHYAHSPLHADPHAHSPRFRVCTPQQTGSWRR